VRATVGREDSRGKGDSCADQGAEGELERGGITLEDDAAHGGLELEGLPKVAAKELLPIVAILNEERLVEIQSVA